MPEKEKGETEKSELLEKAGISLGVARAEKKTVYQSVSLGRCRSMILATVRVSKALLLENMARV